MDPLYRRYINFVRSNDREYFLPKEAYDWLELNRKDPMKPLWPQAVYTQIIYPAKREGLIIQAERGFYRLTEKASKPAGDDDPEFTEYLEKMKRECDQGIVHYPQNKEDEDE